MWEKYFTLKKVKKPGKIMFHGFGEINFESNKLDVDLLYKIHKKHPGYLGLTDEGKKHFESKEEKQKPSKEESKK